MKNFDIEDPITKLNQVSTKRGEVLIANKISTLKDLLYYFPRKHLDRSNITKIKDIEAGNKYNIVGRVETCGERKTRYKKLYQVIVSDGTGLLTLTWFNSSTYIKKLVKKDDQIAIHGKVDWYNGFSINHPEFDILDHQSNPMNTGAIIPIYPLSIEFKKVGIEQRLIRKLMIQIIDGVTDFDDVFSDDFLVSNALVNIKDALSQLHFPSSSDNLSSAIYRLKFDEHFIQQIFLGLIKSKIKYTKSTIFKDIGPYFQMIRDDLSFELTNAQKKVIAEIHSDLKKSSPMNRLLQGDVGSGKTIVAILSAALAAGNNSQVAVMAPTEILASQHFNAFKKELSKARVTCCLLVGKMNKKDRDKIITNIKNGKITVVIGTHALIQKDVEFEKLRLVIIDEQHRFGVDQRNKLTNKGKSPHLLCMTATPIPRTLSITYMGDMDLSIIDELPKNRIPVTTKIIDPNRLGKVYSFMNKQIEDGLQCMVVYPLVEESEKSDLAAAVEMYNYLKKNTFSRHSVGLIHGKMNSEEKKTIMNRFKQNEIQIIISTTVIEVGIDVPNATVMLIEHAERFGLTQLHQLRGRVGRGKEKSYCILVNRGSNERSLSRLEIMEKTNDGFKIADEDLLLRGPGDYIGFQQSGFVKYKIANVLTDGPIIRKARTIAFKMIHEDPHLDSHIGIKNLIFKKFRKNLDLVNLN